MHKGAGLIILFISAVLYWISFSMIRPIVVLYFGSEGYSVSIIGALMAIQAVIPVLFAMPAGSLIDRIGSRNAVFSGSALLMLSGILYWAGGSLGLLLPLIVGQVVSGVGSLLSWGALQASAAQSSRKLAEVKKDDHLLSNFTFVNSLAQFGGPLLGGVIADGAGYEAVFLIYTGFALLSILFAWLIPKLGKPISQTREVSFNLLKSYGSGIGLMRVNKPFTLAIFINGVLFIIIDIKGTFFPIYLAKIGFTNTQVGLMLSVGGIASVIIRPFVGHLVRRLGHEPIMTLSMVIGASCLIALVFEPAIWLLSVIVFLWGMCAGVNQPMALIMVAKTVDPSQQGMGMSLRTMSNRVVQVINPVVFGALSGVIGLTLGFGAVGVMLLGVAAYMQRVYKNDKELEYAKPLEKPVNQSI
jgi:MFS family permease